MTVIEQIFPYQQWLHERLHEQAQSSRPPQIRGREIAMFPIQYGAALMQAYIGKASLAWVAELTGIPLQRLRQWRQEPQFLLVIDWSKSIFSNSFQEDLILSDYSVAQYHYMSGEISLLEESLRIAIRMPLYQRFTKLGKSLISRHQNDLPLTDYDLRLFRRLFLFFLALEHHWPSQVRRHSSKEFLPLAKDVVWPLLEQEQWLGPALESVQQAAPLSRIRSQLDRKLKETLKSFL